MQVFLETDGSICDDLSWDIEENSSALVIAHDDAKLDFQDVPSIFGLYSDGKSGVKFQVSNGFSLSLTLPNELGLISLSQNLEIVSHSKYDGKAYQLEGFHFENIIVFPFSIFWKDRDLDTDSISDKTFCIKISLYAGSVPIFNDVVEYTPSFLSMRNLTRLWSKSRIFASYSREDTGVVEDWISTVESTGFVEVIYDRRSIEPGEKWQTKIEKLIQSCDSFQLFWSLAASRSKNVENEIRYALSLNRRNFVKPVYWKSISNIPDQLSEIQFHPISCYMGKMSPSNTISESDLGIRTRVLCISDDDRRKIDSSRKKDSSWIFSKHKDQLYLPNKGFLITCTLSGKQFEWDQKSVSLLEFLQKQKIHVKTSCKVGRCSMCSVVHLGGHIVQTVPLDKYGARCGQARLCCSVPESHISLLI